jgi:outer membrane protein assembly factor BamB
VLYVPSFDKSVYALQTRGGSAGTALWNYTTDGPVVAAPSLSSSSLLFFGSSDGLLYALHTAPSPALNWTFNSAAPLFSSGTVTLLSPPPLLLACDSIATSGHQQWCCGFGQRQQVLLPARPAAGHYGV